MIRINKKILIFGGIGIATFGADAQSRQPNIIFIMSDDHASQAISCYNGELNSTPNIDRLAKNGVRFTNCFCTNAISAPSRASILTGTFNHINGLFNNNVAFDTAQITLPKVLKNNGYQTAIIGKWHLKTYPSGFDYWNILPGQGNYYNPDFITNGKKQQVKGYVTDLITDNAIGWIENRDKSKPFFIMVHHKAPHRNWMPRLDQIKNYWNKDIPIPENFHDNYSQRNAANEQELSIENDMTIAYDLKIIHPDSSQSLEARYMGLSRMDKSDREEWILLYRNRYDEYLTIDTTKENLAEYKYKWYMQDYLATIDAVDESVGDITNYLRNNDLDSNTIIIYTSDQGFFLGEHGWFDKRFMYDESLRMPLIIYDPRIVHNTGLREQMVMNIDFAPTILEYANASIPDRMQGKSMQDILENKNADGRTSIYYHYFEYPGPHSVKRHYGIRTNRYKLIHFYHDINEWELYDLEKDPREMNSLFNAPEYSDVRFKLMLELEKTRMEYGDTIGNTIPQALKLLQNKAKVKSETFKYQPHSKYKGTGSNSLHDGLVENLSPLNTNGYQSWLGFQGDNLDVNWELEESQFIESITFRVINSPGSWIFLPKSILIEILEDDKVKQNFTSYSKKTESRPNGGSVTKYIFQINKEVTDLRFLIENIGICPSGHPGEGQKAWLFIDEIIVK